jgi:protein CpxP
MTQRKIFHFISAGATVLGVALCLPAAMLAQTTAPSPDSQGVTAPQTDSQGGTQGSMSMHRHHRASPERQLKRMTKKLNLTADQQQQILPILQDQQKQMESMRADTSLSPDQRRQQARTLMQGTHQKIEAILTDTQKQQFEQEMQQRREHMRNHRMGQGPGAAPSGTPPPPDQQTSPTPPPPPPQQ